MRATIDVECTPAEARGCRVADSEPMQAAVMERLQKRMLSEIDKFSPEIADERMVVRLSPKCRGNAGDVCELVASQ